MRFWDSSAVMPLLVAEESSAKMEDRLRDDPAVAIWWGTQVECVSALARLERDGDLAPGDVRGALARFREAAAGWVEVPATSDVREQAIRLLRVHPLRAGDAIQLAAAIVAADFQPSALEFVTLDVRQAEAAEREGFRIAR